MNATDSAAIPTNAFSSLISSANNNTRLKAQTNSQKSVQEISNSSSSYYSSKSFNPLTTSFKTGTNEVATAVAPLSQTPARNIQFPAGEEVSSSAAANNLSSSSAPPLKPTSTNPINNLPTGFTI